MATLAELLALLDPESGDPSEGYITPQNLKDIVSALYGRVPDVPAPVPGTGPDDPGDVGKVLAVAPDGTTTWTSEVNDALVAITNEDALQDNILAVLATEVGNVHILGTRDVVEAIMALRSRVAALEAHTSIPDVPPAPVSEGVMLIDKYSGSFARARPESGFDISDGEDHWFSFALADSGNIGPGGEVIASTAVLFQLGGVVWYDNGGSLGHVKAPTGSDLTATAVSNYINTNRLARGHLDTTTDPSHPNLVLVEVQA